MAILDPTSFRLSPHFLLSDMMGCNSVYTRGLSNVFDKVRGEDIRITNAKTLCEEVLEPLLALAGDFTISYGFISPELSREIVHYQDWRKPSHHRWDLGAAVDVCPHHHVLQSVAKDNAKGAPILFALEHLQDYPLSRLITYSESPYICMAVSAQEVEDGRIRGAWYENRYMGKKGEKPYYCKYPSTSARDTAHQHLKKNGLSQHWKGAGHPTYHGGGGIQLQHMRVSNNTMVIDWLYDQEGVTQGWKNIPSLDIKEVHEAFLEAGSAYDDILTETGLPRLSIVSAYTSHLSKVWIEGRDWRGGDIEFEVVPPSYLSPEEFVDSVQLPGIEMECDEDRVRVLVERGRNDQLGKKKVWIGGKAPLNKTPHKRK